MGVYHISELVYLLGLPKVERVSGKVYQEMDMDEERRVQSGFDVEEMGVGLVRFEGGLTMDIIEAWSVHMNRFEGSSLMGSKGGIRWTSSSTTTPRRGTSTWTARSTSRRCKTGSGSSTATVAPTGTANPTGSPPFKGESPCCRPRTSRWRRC